MSSIFNKFRPKHLSDVLGQDAATQTIKNQLEQGSLPQVNLFFGVHGCGKTTMARILAKTLNCENPTSDGPCCQCDSCKMADMGQNTDIIEIDAAANNGVADVDLMVKNLQYLPMNKKKVVILDEVHNLSKAAFDHLLKPIEEPPAHAVFIFCTTEEKKLPSTILSRCPNKIEFHRIDDELIREQLKNVCIAEEISYEEDALRLLVQEADGSLRDALSALEQVSYGKSVTKDKVLSAFSSSTDEQVLSLLKDVATLSVSEVCGNIAILIGSTNVAVFLQNILSVLLDMLHVRLGMDVMHLNGNGIRTKISAEYVTGLSELVSLFSDADIKLLMKYIANYLAQSPKELNVYSVITILLQYMLAKETLVSQPCFTPVSSGEPLLETTDVSNTPGSCAEEEVSALPEPICAVDNGFEPVDDAEISFAQTVANAASSGGGMYFVGKGDKEVVKENTESVPAPVVSNLIDEDEDEDDIFGTANVRLFE